MESKKAIIYYKDTDNIGDDVQTYAALKLLKNPDYFLDRERLDEAEVSPNTKLLCNGWFMKHPEHWPPHKNLIPLFVSLYIDHKHGCYEKMLADNLIPYYKQFAPIGGRDKNTVKLFKNLGIQSYFSACVTLTLPKYEGEKTDEILFVDPFVKIFDKTYVESQIKRLIPPKYADKVSVITHHDYEIKNLSIEERMEKTQKLLERYAKAKLIITSRIHCALPATALGTPVYFINVGYDRKHSAERLEGLTDFFEVIDASYFPNSGNKPINKLTRKLGFYSKKPIKNNPIDFDLSLKTQKLFKEKQTNARQYGNAIKERVNRFFED